MEENLGTESLSVAFLLNCMFPKYMFRASGPHLLCVEIWGVSHWVQNVLAFCVSCFGSVRSHTGEGDEASQSIISRRRNDLRNAPGHPISFAGVFNVWRLAILLFARVCRSLCAFCRFQLYVFRDCYGIGIVLRRDKNTKRANFISVIFSRVAVLQYV